MVEPVLARPVVRGRIRIPSDAGEIAPGEATFTGPARHSMCVRTCVSLRLVERPDDAVSVVPVSACAAAYSKQALMSAALRYG